jgi:hypothetical protein
MSQADSRNTTNLSRRAALAGLSSAAVALPVAAVALGATEADPIFALIEAHRKSLAAYLAAQERRNRLDRALPSDASHCDTPTLEVGRYKGQRLFCHSEHDIDLSFGLMGMERGIELGMDVESDIIRTIRAEYRKASAEFADIAARCERGNAWREAVGYQAVCDAQDDALGLVDDVGNRLLDTVPTTMAGARALLEHLDQFDWEDCWELPENWEWSVLSAVTTALQTIAA